MAELDLPVDQLRAFTANLQAPADFDAFWAATVAVSRGAPPAPVDCEVVLDMPQLTLTHQTI